MLNRDVFKNGIGLLTATFPNTPFNSEHLWTMLNDLEDQKFSEAVIALCNETKQVYNGTNIIAMVREKATGDQSSLAGEAFGELMAEISRTGSYGMPSFKDPILKKTVDSMGWKSLCHSEEDQRSIIRAQFTKIYESLLKRENVSEINKNVPSLIQNLVKQIEDSK